MNISISINFISWKDKVSNNKVYFENKVLPIADRFQLEFAKFMFGYKVVSLPLNFQNHFKDRRLFVNLFLSVLHIGFFLVLGIQE